MHNWSNEPRLLTLSASVEDIAGHRQELTFLTGLERTCVTLNSGGDVERVTFSSNGKNSRHLEIPISEAHHTIVGEGSWCRDVWQFLLPGGPSPIMRVGITKQHYLVSSTPHDFEMNLEPGFEEVFFHILEGGSKKAVQLGCGMWCDGTKANEIWTAHDRTFSTIPMGVHPVVAEPGVMVSYVWCYLAKHKHWEKVK